jgi:hypothetical protein
MGKLLDNRKFCVAVIGLGTFCTVCMVTLGLVMWGRARGASPMPGGWEPDVALFSITFRLVDANFNYIDLDIVNDERVFWDPVKEVDYLTRSPNGNVGYSALFPKDSTYVAIKLTLKDEWRFREGLFRVILSSMGEGSKYDLIFEEDEHTVIMTVIKFGVVIFFGYTASFTFLLVANSVSAKLEIAN